MFAPRIAKPKSAPPQRSAVAAQRPGHATVAQGQLLQRMTGNQAVPRLLTQRASATRNEPGADEVATRVVAGRSAVDLLGPVAVRGAGGWMQRKTGGNIQDADEAA